jgi:imidazole glycerol-phosphate synthase subunit HisH
MIGIIDYGSGNFTSVCNAIRSLGLEYVPVSTPDDLESATHLILPGVGAYNDCVDTLKAKGLFRSLQKITTRGEKFFLGICVGHQILSDFGTEFSCGEGFGAIPGNTVKLKVENDDRLPHIGWNNVSFSPSSSLFRNIEEGATFYFVHSYQLMPKAAENIIAWTHHSSKITAAVRLNNCFGVQFHPEKSQKNGLQLLLNFSELK